MKAIQFLRVSTQEQGNSDRTGLPRQREANAITIEKHSLTLIKTITIIDVSGTSVLHTPEVKELLSLIESPDIAGVVVADWDRLIRLDNFRDFALLQHIKETDTLIYLPDQVIDLNTQSGFLIGGFQSIISGNELSQIKKRMLKGKEIKRKNGEHPNSLISLPLGVSYDYSEKKFFYTHDVHKVKRLFELFYAQGIHNYRELERMTGIHHRTIANLLRNEIYIGYRTYKEKRGGDKTIKPNGRQGDKKKVKRQPHEIIRVKVIDDPIIDETVFWNVQEIMATKNREYHTKRPSNGERFLYSGFLRCGVCGERLYSTSGGRNHKKDYYCCRTKHYLSVKRNGPSRCCSSYMRKECVEESITSFVSERLTDKDYLRHMIKVALSDSNYRKMRTEAAELKKAIKRIEKKRSRILDLYGDGGFTKQELDRKVFELNAEISVLRSRLARIEESFPLNERAVMEKQIEPIVTTLAEFAYWSPTQKRTFLRSQIPEFLVTNEGITGFTLNFCKLGNHKGTDSWQPPA